MSLSQPKALTIILCLISSFNLIACDDKPSTPSSSQIDSGLTSNDLTVPDQALMDSDSMSTDPSDAEVGESDTSDAEIIISEQRCGPLEACPQGYECLCEQEEACECVAPMKRGGCNDGLVCRAGEECREVRSESSGTTQYICWLEESLLLAKSGISQSEGESLWVGASSQSITPLGFETPNPEGLDGVEMNFSPPISAGDPRWNDCGYDGLCPDDEGYIEPDPGEGDGELQGAFIGGFGHGRPAQYCPEELLNCDRPECCFSKLAHDDLKAQVLVMRRGELSIAFVALDVIGLFHSDIEQIRRELAQALSEQEQLGQIDHLIVGSSHNHEGPDSIGQYGAGSLIPLRTGRDRRWMAYLRSQVVKGITESLKRLEPAKAEYFVSDDSVMGLGIGDSRPPYIFDNNIPSLRFTSVESGECIANMLSVANHAEFLWAGNPYLSADYFHFTRKYLQEGLAAVLDESGNEQKSALPGWGGVTVMFAGAVGGLMNPGSATAINYAGESFSGKSFAMADAAGQQIAARLLSAYQDGRFENIDNPTNNPAQASVAVLSYASQEFFTTIENMNFLLAGFTLKLFQRDIYNSNHLGGNSFFPDLPRVITEVTALSLGPVTFFTAPGEVFPELLTGGYPDRGQAQTPVVGDQNPERLAWNCDERGLPAGLEGSLGGALPCIVKENQSNPPTWSEAPVGPYIYEEIELVNTTSSATNIPFFIGVAGDFLGYIIPAYDFELGASSGSHYEETNSASQGLTQDWQVALRSVLEHLPNQD